MSTVAPPSNSTSAASPDARGSASATRSPEPSLARNVASSVGAKLLYLVSRVFLPPLTLAYVSLEEYGIWATCFILIGYIGMTAFGVSNVYIRYVAQYQAEGQSERINHLVTTGVSVVSALGLTLLLALWLFLPTIIDAFSISAAARETAFVLIFATAAIFVVDLSWGAFAYVLHGLQRIYEHNLVWVTSFLLETALIVAFLLMGWGIYALLVAFAIRYVVSIAGSAWLCFRYLPDLSLRPKYFDRSVVKLFVSYGGVVQIAGFLGMLQRSIEKVIAGVFMDVRATGLFDVGQKLSLIHI